MTDARVRAIQLPDDVHERVKKYAAANNLSVSAAVAEIMAAYASGNPYPARKRQSKRIGIWIQPEVYAAFRKRAREEKVTIASALEAVLEEAL